MFDVYCPTHGSRVLLGPRRIETLTNTPAGVVVEWRCYCGTQGTLSFAPHTHTAPAPAEAA
jgi:hypothetical protein